MADKNTGLTRGKIQDWLQDNPGWHTTEEIANAVGCSRIMAINHSDNLRKVVEKNPEPSGKQSEYRRKEHGC